MLQNLSNLTQWLKFETPINFDDIQPSMKASRGPFLFHCKGKNFVNYLAYCGQEMDFFSVSNASMVQTIIIMK